VTAPATGLDLSRIACVSIATPSIHDLLPAFTEGLGLEVTHDIQVSPRGFGLRWIEVGSGGRTLFELMEPTGEDGPVAKFLQRNPSGGVYQIRLLTDDIAVTLETLAGRGLTVIPGQVVSGAPSAGWVHPRSTGGMLLEMLERHPAP
jgi:methylmalonyl-CoA/ethylmalonyl-CoA epimerase